MKYHFKNNDPIAYTNTDEADIVMNYIDREPAHETGQYAFLRHVRANIADDDDDGDVVIEINAVDNCNGGIFSFHDVLEDAPGGERIEFSDVIRVPKKEIEDRTLDDAVDTRSLSDLVIQDVKEWSDNTAFKSEPEIIPEKFKFDS
ncbi:hypothetical protein [Haladaptatus salinisoli]|uniref:hypothetical protein n=1 Tax=Haladaptatus salinisoli TaxID=2884876 RepID=UPI001D09DF38|nr:hypothetical protein [Haladaptatus salinisoli]